MEPLKQALEETGMWKVYTQIELPLIFTLDSMEKTGIQVKGEELKAYGDRLAVRIHELEQAIYQQAGEEFNINSPKQLGRGHCLKRWGLHGREEDQNRLFHGSRCAWRSWPDSSPVVKHILEYRGSWPKLKSTYADGLAAYD